MVASRKQAVKIGIFVIAVAAILLLALFVIGGLRIWKRVDTYYVISEEAVSGVDINSAVTLRGVAIGKVKAIELDPKDYARVRIAIEIDSGIEIPVGSKAYFEPVGLTGERALDISGGTLADGQLAPGSTIPREQTQLEQLETRVVELGNDLSTLIADMSATVQHIETLVAAVEPERIESILAHTKRAVVHGRVDIDAITRDVDAVASKATTALERADATLQVNQDDLRAAVQNFRGAAEEAKALLEQLREQPSLLLRPPKQSKKRKRRHKRKRS
jgi:phospholipid/cholesterol/gamma-HCH transport system substrate-binding protein